MVRCEQDEVVEVTPRDDRKPSVPEGSPPKRRHDDNDDDDDDDKSGPGREERDRMNDRGRARSKGRTSRRRHERSKSEGLESREAEEKFGITKCEICKQKVGGGLTGFENHLRGLPWNQALARANKEWARLWAPF